ncbi:MAG: sulfite oxidase [Dehalococcoidia bacterium]
MVDVASNPTSDLRMMSQSPLVAGAHMESFDQWVTPTNQYFIRNHFPMPAVAVGDWTLRVDGAVHRELSLSYQDLRRIDNKEIHSLLECAGNSRSTIQPQIEGLLWDHGAVGNASWKGIPVNTLLARAGIKDSAMEVLFEGADRGTENGAVGEISFAASLPLGKAMHPDTLLAYEMNGEPLTPEHGFPLRLVVPGWFGMGSVKWLVNIRVLEHPFQGFHQTRYYVFVEEGDDDTGPKERVTSMRVKSLINWPGRGSYLPPGRHLVRGVAWSGEGPVVRVKISTDNGTTWHTTALESSQSPYSWQHWEFEWEANQPGYFMVRSRATDTKGNVQPEQAEWNFRGFGNNAIHAVPVTITAR